MSSYLVLSYKDFLDLKTNLILSKAELKKLEDSGIVINYNIPMYFNYEGKFPILLTNKSVNKFKLFDFEYEIINYSNSRVKGVFGNLHLGYSFAHSKLCYIINGKQYELNDKKTYSKVKYLAHVTLTLHPSSIVNFGYKINRYKISYKGTYMFDAECFIFGVYCIVLNEDYKTEALGVMLDCKTGEIDLGVLIYNKNYRLTKIKMLNG